MASKRKSTKSTKKTTNYEYVAPNVYRDGSSYRARVSVNGVRYSQNCKSKTKAIQWRNTMLAEQA